MFGWVPWIIVGVAFVLMLLFVALIHLAIFIKSKVQALILKWKKTNSQKIRSDSSSMS